MSHSQFPSTNVVILRHAWLNLWDKHMTTGRINQVTNSSNLQTPHLREGLAITLLLTLDELSIGGSFIVTFSLQMNEWAPIQFTSFKHCTVVHRKSTKTRPITKPSEEVSLYPVLTYSRSLCPVLTPPFQKKGKQSQGSLQWRLPATLPYIYRYTAIVTADLHVDRCKQTWL